MNEPTRQTLPNHLHFFNHHTGHPRFQFDEASDAAAAAAAAAQKPWHDGIEAELIGHAQNKGWKLDTPKDAFAASAKVARDLEKHFGVPADRLLKLPAADAKSEEMAAFYQRLGAPAKPEEYDFAAIKNAAGEAIAPPLADALRATAHAKGLTKDAAAAVAQAVVKHMDETAAAKNAIDTAKLAEEKATLRKNWTPEKYDFNHLTAMEGARKAGITPEAVKAMEGQAGYASVMEHFRKIGAGMSEDAFHQGGGQGGNPTTREGAAAKLAELEADKAWGKRLTAGDAVAKAEWLALTALISAEAA